MMIWCLSLSKVDSWFIGTTGGTGSKNGGNGGSDNSIFIIFFSFLFSLIDAEVLITINDLDQLYKL